MSTQPTPPGPDGLGSLLLRVRRMHGRSQQRLAEQLCAVAGLDTVSRHEISRWEREERIPSRFWLAWLSVVLGIGTADLERATVRTRAWRAAGRIGTGTGADGSIRPWRVLAANRGRDARGRIVVRITPSGSPRPDPPP